MFKMELRDGTIMEAPIDAIKHCTTLKDAIEQIEHDEEDMVFPIMEENITKEQMEKIIEFCIYYNEVEDKNKFLPPKPMIKRMSEYSNDWLKSFIKVDEIYDEHNYDLEKDLKYRDFVFPLMNAANFLACEPLVEICAAASAEMLRGKPQDHMRKIFEVEDDHTPEELEQIRQENAWLYE